MSAALAIVPREFARARLARSKLGDQVATAVLYDLGQRVRGVTPTDPAVLKKLKPIYAAALALRKQRTAVPSDMTLRARWSWWPFGRKNAAPDFGAEPPASTAAPLVLPPASDPESRKPPVPAGLYDAILGPGWAEACAKADQYRNGLAGAALVLASGPAIDAAWIEAAMEAMTPIDALGFFEASSDPTSRDPAARCVAMARWIQRARDVNRPLGGMVGWELGEGA